MDEFSRKDLGKLPDVYETVTGVAGAAADLFAGWFRDIRPNERPAVLMILAGYRESGGKLEPMIYLLNSQLNFAPQLFADKCLAGVPQYAVYLFHRYYQPNITLDRAKALAEYLIAETASQDPKVGGPIHIAEVTPQKGYRKLTAQDVEVISQKNATLNAKLKKFFLSGVAKR